MAQGGERREIRLPITIVDQMNRREVPGKNKGKRKRRKGNAKDFEVLIMVRPLCVCARVLPRIDQSFFSSSTEHKLRGSNLIPVRLSTRIVTDKKKNDFQREQYWPGIRYGANEGKNKKSTQRIEKRTIWATSFSLCVFSKKKKKKGEERGESKEVCRVSLRTIVYVHWAKARFTLDHLTFANAALVRVRKTVNLE